MKRSAAFVRRLAAALTLALPLLSQSPVTVTPTLVSVQLGQPLYCAAKWTSATKQVQVYCYTSTAGHTWDSLIYNSIFLVNTTATLPYVETCPVPNGTTTPGCAARAGIMWIFSQDAATAGLVHWQVGWNGTGIATGTFQ